MHIFHVAVCAKGQPYYYFIAFVQWITIGYRLQFDSLSVVPFYKQLLFYLQSAFTCGYLLDFFEILTVEGAP